MNKILSALAFLFFSAGSFAQAPLRIVATASIFADMAANIAGNHGEVLSIVPPGSDPHLYEPTPADAALIANADLILRNGLTFESWLDDLLENASKKARTVTITDGIVPIQAAAKNSSDPHAWMDASNGLIYIENIKNALVDADPGNGEVYAFNHAVYRQQLQDLDGYIRTQIAGIPPEHRLLITSHDAFQYYGRRYGLRLEAILGISTEMEARTSDLSRLENAIRESGVPAVFVETTVNPKLLKQIAKDNKVSIGGALFADSLGDKDSPAPDYISMLRHNTDVIVRGLRGDGAGVAPETPPAEKESEKSSWILWAVLVSLMVAGFVFVAFKVSN